MRDIDLYTQISGVQGISKNSNPARTGYHTSLIFMTIIFLRNVGKRIFLGALQQSLWRVGGVEVNMPKGEVTARVEREVGAQLCCPTSSGQQTPGCDLWRWYWRHLDICQYKTILEAALVQCSEHWAVTATAPRVGPGSGFTALFVIDWLKEPLAAAVACLMRPTIDDGIMQRAVNAPSRRSVGWRGMMMFVRSILGGILPSVSTITT